MMAVVAHSNVVRLEAALKRASGQGKLQAKSVTEIYHIILWDEEKTYNGGNLHSPDTN